jgi:cyanophycin synthetase
MTEAPIQIVRVVAMPGYAYGLMQPALSVTISVPAGQRQQLVQRFDAAFSEVFGPGSHVAPIGDTARQSQSEILHTLGYWALRISHDAGYPMLGEHRIVVLQQKPEQKRNFYLLLLPCVTARPMEQILRHLVGELRLFSDDVDRVTLPEKARQSLDDIIEQLRLEAPAGTNNKKFVSAAHALGIPCFPLPGGLYQYGWGRFGRLMSSSTTDATGVIAARSARNKLASGLILHQAGLPVPAFAMARDAETAAIVAERIGYPVVLKPADLDGGVGVSVFLRNGEQVKQAYDKARAHSSNIIVQKHVNAPEHRLNVFKGRLIGAAMRLPAGVTGDGRSTISELVEKANAEPTRKPHKRDGAPPLKLEKVETDLLEMQGLRVDAVPAEGLFVRLAHETRRGTGGTTEAITEKVHPDNAALAVQTAALFRLDIAGIDLLCPDISRSWKEVGAAITEINSAPQYGEASGALPEIILRDLIKGQGRIPIVLALDMSPDAAMGLSEALSSALKQGGLCLAASLQDRFWDGQGWIRHHRNSVSQGVRTILMRPEIDVGFFSLTTSDILRAGWPVDRSNIIILDDIEARDTPLQAPLTQRQSSEERLRLLAMSRAHVLGTVCLRVEHPDLEKLRRVFNSGQLRTIATTEALAKVLAASLIAAATQKAA